MSRLATDYTTRECLYEFLDSWSEATSRIDAIYGFMRVGAAFTLEVLIALGLAFINPQLIVARVGLYTARAIELMVNLYRKLKVMPGAVKQV
ncbi:MAG: hypothetical protein R3194_11550, partial [Limnobacter sp.]|nr:hypothetical protein [Limnobacter sp.]